MYKRFKHINIIYYYVRNLYKSNCIRVAFVVNVNIIVNKLIKLLFKNKFKIFINQFKLKDSNNSKSCSYYK